MQFGKSIIYSSNNRGPGIDRRHGVRVFGPNRKEREKEDRQTDRQTDKREGRKNLGSITSRCSGNEPTLAGPEGAAEIDPRKNRARSTSLVRVLEMVNKQMLLCYHVIGQWAWTASVLPGIQ